MKTVNLKNRKLLHWSYLVFAWIFMLLPFFTGQIIIPFTLLIILLIFLTIDLFLLKDKYKWFYIILNPFLLLVLYGFVYSSFNYFNNKGKIYVQNQEFKLNDTISPFIQYEHSALLDKYRYLGFNGNVTKDGHFEPIHKYIFYNINDKIINFYSRKENSKKIYDQRVPSLDTLYMMCQNNKFDSIIPIKQNGYDFMFKVNNQIISYNPSKAINSNEISRQNDSFMTETLQDYYINKYTYNSKETKPTFKDIKNSKYLYYNKDYYPIILIYNKNSNLSNTWLGEYEKDGEWSFKQLILHNYDVTLMDVENPSFTVRFLLSDEGFPKLFKKEYKKGK
jgi:hypothetical protein